MYRAAKREREGLQEELLRGCYRKSLELARENGCKSVAFSALSTGVYGYPSGEAAEAVCKEVRRWLDGEGGEGEPRDIVICNFMEKDEDAYEEWLPRYFPPVVEEGQGKAEEGKEEGNNTKTKEVEGKTEEQESKLT